MKDNSSTEVLGDSSKRILLDIIGQLTSGMELARISLPVFILEPLSMLERITNFSAHPNLLLEAIDDDDPESRFISVVRYFLSGWHIKAQGVKKPYNPVLGEFFRCQYKFDDGSKGYYFAEQVSHHPPISAYFFANPQKGLVIKGDLRPKSRFLGNSAATLMHGSTHITMLSRNSEAYDITFPNAYAKGIVIGTMHFEIGGHSTVQCKASDLVCNLDFKTTGLFHSHMNRVHGHIKQLSTGHTLYEITGGWDDKLYIKNTQTKEEKLLLDVNVLHRHELIVEPEERQELNESRRCWSLVTQALNAGDMDTATQEKYNIEERQRQEGDLREQSKKAWSPKYFDLIDDIYTLKCYSSLNINNALEAESMLENTLFQ
ncbi:hypothetical protein INT44_001172 [Umbelopsis vinacea]|uniref:Oxysterol-binding protein n=1 Tax=Umbelopsis vinacea TaxID=44442 RepID=A0A8H7QAT4_9FUNG|nr:hypothetical protein INT44_001172 [Umbelopsis vinacea]